MLPPAVDFWQLLPTPALSRGGILVNFCQPFSKASLGQQRVYQLWMRESFNWRLILAPPFVLRYLVTHEAVHLAVPDHSLRFWLTVQSLCPDTQRAKQWLSVNGHRLQIELAGACPPS